MPISIIPGYDVYKEETTAGGTVWKLKSATHLSPDANVGRHNIYVTAVDDLGVRVNDPNVKIGWSWEGRRGDEPADPLPLDKRDGEPPGNVPLYSPGMKASVWIADPNHPSDIAYNLHTNHPDELGPDGEKWNSIGHHSFNLVFQRVGTASMPPPPPDEQEPQVIIITSPNMTITMLDGRSTSGPGTIKIVFSQGQEFARG